MSGSAEKGNVTEPVVKTRSWRDVALKGVLIAAVALLLADEVRDRLAGDLLEPDTAPAEYLYLDNARVRAYLGQLVDGLPESEKRTLVDSEELAAEVKAGGAGLSDKQTRSTTTDTLVKPTVADRFYLLLRLLRAGDSDDESGNSRNWLTDLGGQTEGPQNVYEAACKVREGDFVRIRNAHLTLSPYAAVLPNATYALLDLEGGIDAPAPGIFTPRTRAKRRQVKRYRRSLGKDPRLPFIVRQLSSEPGPGRSAGVTFFIPARYLGLRNEPSLISGTLTIVGKVVYRNLGRTDKRGGARVSCGEPVHPSVPESYVDRQTVATFVPALIDGPDFVVNNLEFTEGTIAGNVRRNMTVKAPVVVVIPIAMYQ